MSTEGFAGGAMAERPGELPAVAVPAGARLVLASGNAKKLSELRAILAGVLPGFQDEWVVGLGEVGLESPVEDGATFEEISALKANAVVRATGLAAVADDSGIIVDVLGRAPGIFSARWAGVGATDERNLQLLLEQLADLPDHHRGARFVCAATLVTPDGSSYTEVGEIEGTLLREPRGTGGFGYDPIFQPLGYTRTTAELPPEEKNRISHRSKALRALSEEIAAALSHLG